MSGLGMMLMGAAWMALSWIFVRYYGVSTVRVFVFVVGATLLIKGVARAIGSN